MAGQPLISFDVSGERLNVCIGSCALPKRGQQCGPDRILINSMKTNRNPVGWFEIYVQDIERAKAFYQETFQVTLEQLENPDVELWAFPMLPERPGCAGAIAKMSGKGSGSGGTIVYCWKRAGRISRFLPSIF
jgi:hypothetical protein